MRSKLWTKISGLFVFAGVALGCATGAVMNNDMHKVSAAETNKVAVFNLGADGSASHYDGTSKSEYEETSGSYTLTFTGASGMYTGARDATGNGCIKLGTKSAAGGFTFTVPENVTSTVIYAGKYKANTSKLSINGTEYTLSNSSDNGAYDAITVDTSSTKSVTLTTVSGGYRAMINTIEYYGTGSAVVEKQLQSIALTIGDYQKTYKTTDSWSKENLTVTATYNIGDPVDVTEDAGFTFEPAKPEEGLESVTITASFGGKNSSQTVTGLNVTAPAVSSDVWTLVTDASELAEGDKVIIAAKDADVALSTTQNGNNRGQYAITKTGDTAVVNEAVQQLTLEEGTITDTYAFNTGSGYLYAASASSNHLKTETKLSDNSSWTISIDGATGVATIKAQGTNTRNWLRYNKSNNPPIFSCYGSGQTDICLYKLGAASTATLVSIDLTVAGTYETDYTTADASWDTEGLKVVATYDDAKTKIVTGSANITFNPATPSAAGIGNDKTLTISAEFNGKTDTEEVTVNVSEPAPLTCAEAKVVADGETVTVRGIVVGFYKGKCFLIVDKETSEGLIVYEYNNTLSVGDQVLVTGELTTYSGLKEINSGCTIVTESTGHVVTPRVVDLETETDLSQHITDYVTVKNMKYNGDVLDTASNSGININTEGLVVRSESYDKAHRAIWNDAFANYKDLTSTVVFDFTGIMGVYNETPQLFLGSTAVIDVNEYVTFVNYMNETVKDVCGANPETVTGETWTTAETLFGYLSAAEKAAFKALAADQAGTAEQQAAARYDQIVAKRSGKDFAGRDTGATSNRVTSILNNNNNNLVLIIVIASSLVAVAAIAFIYYRKRQLNK